MQEIYMHNNPNLTSIVSTLKDLMVLNSCNRFYTTFYCWHYTNSFKISQFKSKI